MSAKELLDTMLANLQSWATSHAAVVAGHGNTDDVLAFAKLLRYEAEHEWLIEPEAAQS
jgi:hypothetical protein